MPYRIVAAVLGLFALSICGAGFARADDGYVLGPSDHLRLKVYEWRASRGETYQWAPLTGDFTVSAGGFLSLPLVGDIDVRSRTTVEVGSIVSDRLQKQMGLVERPSTSIEVIQFRP